MNEQCQRSHKKVNAVLQGTENEEIKNIYDVCKLR